MRLFYNLFIRLYPLLAKLMGLFSPKAKKWSQGRKNILAQIAVLTANNQAPIIWFHCASLGEFEQGRPLIEYIKATHPNYKIALSFFSPSGYEIRKNYPLADFIFYLPMDSNKNAQQLIAILQPKLVIFVKYEFWYYYLKTLNNKKIPTYLISAIFREKQLFFKPWGGFYRRILGFFDHIFVQDELSKSLLENIHLNAVTVAGDTRFDRVKDIADNWQPIPDIAEFIGTHLSIVAGSTWPEDDAALAPSARKWPAVKFILASHEIDQDRIEQCMENFPHSIRFTDWEKMTAEEKRDCHFQTLIIDNIGLLSRIYHYATITYVGGAWGKSGIHNTLEAAVYGKPVLFGPNHGKSREVQQLIDAGASFQINDIHACSNLINKLLQQKDFCDACAQNAERFVAEKTGATSVILKKMENHLEN